MIQTQLTRMSHHRDFFLCEGAKLFNIQPKTRCVGCVTEKRSKSLLCVFTLYHRCADLHKSIKSHQMNLWCGLSARSRDILRVINILLHSSRPCVYPLAFDLWLCIASSARGLLGFVGVASPRLTSCCRWSSPQVAVHTPRLVRAWRPLCRPASAAHYRRACSFAIPSTGSLSQLSAAPISIPRAITSPSLAVSLCLSPSLSISCYSLRRSPECRIRVHLHSFWHPSDNSPIHPFSITAHPALMDLWGSRRGVWWGIGGQWETPCKAVSPAEPRRDKQPVEPHADTQRRNNAELPVSLVMCMCQDCGRNLEKKPCRSVENLQNSTQKGNNVTIWTWIYLHIHG